MTARKQSSASPALASFEDLEDRRMMVYWPGFVEMDKVFQQYPWLNGAGHGVAVIDRGIDYLHPRLGGNPVTNTPSPRIVNVWDWNDNDANPFPTDPPTGPDPLSAHATGVAGVLAMLPYKNPKDGLTYQGLLQGSTLYNLRESFDDSQNSIAAALQWVLDNHAKYNITAINLTDFVGTTANIPVYESQIEALWNAGVFMITPVANNWLGDPETGLPAHTAIGYPGKSPYIFATGGLDANGTGVRTETQRGINLDLLAPAVNVWIPYYTPSTGVHEWVQGTGNSWGTPMVTGTAVMLQQIDPTIKPAEIMQIIQDGGVWVADTAANAAISGYAGYKRIDVLGAVKLAYSRRDDAYDQGTGNDTLATAATIALDGSGKGSLTNLKLLAHDHDYYTFTIGADGQFNFTATAGAQLLDSHGNVIGTFGAGGGLSGQALAAGTYYVHAYSDTQGLASAYSVSIQAVPTDPPPTAPGANGTFNDMKYDAGGNLHFVWYDASDKTLKYAARDAGKVWGPVQTIDSAPDVGNFVSLALDASGKPAVAYYDATNADLKYASFNGATWDVTTVESTNTVGYYPSLKFDNAGNPIIAYYYKTGGDLRVATRVGGGAWQVSTVDSNGDVGRYPSLALNPASGAWSIAYEATGVGAFKYAQRNGSVWSTTLVDQNGAGGGYISLAFDANNRPAFSYYDAWNADLKFARFNGSTWSKTTVAAKNSQGLYTNLFFDDGNDPVIYYFNKTANSLVRAQSSAGVFGFQILITNGGRENRVARDDDGNETYSYFDPTTLGLQVNDR
ncbi:MAG TPA: S8 family serine peptidase [Tepidisphaeraceae bacterium]